MLDLNAPHPLSDTDRALLADLPPTIKAEMIDELRRRWLEIADSGEARSHDAEVEYYGAILAAMQNGTPSKAAAILATKTLPASEPLFPVD